VHAIHRIIDRLNRPLLCRVSLFLFLYFLSFFNPLSLAQLVGEQAELERLEAQATNAMAIGDLHGAALSIGKAAMMAAILGKENDDRVFKSVYAGVEALFRTQENAYRALALFDQAGGQSPAPSGACQLLDLANHYHATAQKVFSDMKSSGQSEAASLAQRYTPQTHEWREIIQELRIDFACP